MTGVKGQSFLRSALLSRCQLNKSNRSKHCVCGVG